MYPCATIHDHTATLGLPARPTVHSRLAPRGGQSSCARCGLTRREGYEGHLRRSLDDMVHRRLHRAGAAHLGVFGDERSFQQVGLDLELGFLHESEGHVLEKGRVAIAVKTRRSRMALEARREGGRLD